MKIQAVSLYLKCLDDQIKDAGGEGYNCDVKVAPITGSFSHAYTFNTADGEKTLITPNTFCVGVIHDERDHFVEFNADTGSYDLVTPRLVKKEAKKVLFLKLLGNSFSETLITLKQIWPNRAVWDLTPPKPLAF
ncbi:MAG: hypothetical protein ACJAS1_001651 [Oleiphilaceae bacterium]|jgi:hypothetical protein